MVHGDHGSRIARVAPLTTAPQPLSDEDLAAHELVPSLQHGAAAKQSFLLDYDVAINHLIGTRDVAAAQAMMVEAAERAGFGE